MSMATDIQDTARRDQLESNSSLAAVALLGRRDRPTDALRDYCSFLSEAFGRRGAAMETAEVSWDMQGWLRALRQLWKKSQAWGGRWVLLQYTALMWSRRGLPLGLLLVLWLLKLRGSKICVVFHDISGDAAQAWKQKLGIALQYQVMRIACRWAERSVLTVPLEQVPWLPRNIKHSFFIPIGPNFPETPESLRDSAPGAPKTSTIAVFGITGGARTSEEVADIAYAARQAKSRGGRLRLVALGRGSAEAAADLRKQLNASGVELSALGLLPAEQVRQTLARADVLLFVRGFISSRRSSAIAGIACGLPIVGYRGQETGFPVTEAGVLLVPRNDREALADALARVLGDEPLRRELRQRSLAAAQKYFSWDAIAAQFIGALADG